MLYNAFQKEHIRLEIKLLGSFCITSADQLLADEAAGKVWALLAYLATEHAHPHRRERLAALLWPDHCDRTARQNLRWALATLRRELADQDAASPVLLVTRETIQFNTAGAQVDLHRINQALAALPADPDAPLGESQAQQLAAAVECYSGDFLETFSLEDSVDFEEWMLLTRERLRRQILAALAALVDHHRRQGAHHLVQGYARRWLEYEPWSEKAHRALMQALACAGRRAAAIDQYRRCCRVLDDEFGLEPEPATTELYQQLLQPTPPAGRSNGAAHSSSLSLPASAASVTAQNSAEPTIPEASSLDPDATYHLLENSEQLESPQAIPPSASGKSDRNRRMMVQRVWSIWIEGLLERSQPVAERINLRLLHVPAQVDAALIRQYQELTHEPEFVPDGMAISTIFAQAGGALLILGEPGAGKTTLLLELCRALLGEARQDEAAPIPVVFNLSSWSTSRQSLRNWLVEELTIRYDIPTAIAANWIDQDRILPLLDGLDEVRPAAQAACVDAINTYHREHLVPLAVCARSADYATVDRRLTLQRAVLIQALTDDQISEYVASGGPELAGVAEVLQRDDELRAMVSTPLMLNVLTLACAGRRAECMPAALPAPQQRRALFAAYVERVLNRRGAHAPYTVAQTIHWLRWLARRMDACNQSIFLIEQLQPAWLANQRQLRCYQYCDRLGWGVLGSAVAFFGIFLLFWLLGMPNIGVLLGLSCGLTTGLVGGLFGSASASSEPATPELRDRLVAALLGWLVIAPASALLAALSTILLSLNYDPLKLAIEIGSACGMCGIFAGLLLGRPGLKPRQIVPTEMLRWSWRQFRRHIGPLLLLGGLIGLLLQFLLRQISNTHYVGPLEGLLMALVVGLLAGFKSDALEQQLYPNQGMRRSSRIALASGGIAALLTIMVASGYHSLHNGSYFGLARELTASTSGLLGMYLVLGLGLGLGTAFAAGGRAVLSHLALRFVLWRAGSIAWNCAQFLDSCAARILLRRIGGGYAFMHRTLLEYFATLDDDEVQRIEEGTVR